MIIFKGTYEKVNFDNNTTLDPELINKLKEAMAIVEESKQGVTCNRSPLTLVEISQINDTTKALEKVIIDFYKGKATKKNRKMLDNYMVSLRTSVDNILKGGSN